MGNVFIIIKLMRVRVICKLADWGHEQRPGVRGFLGEERGGGGDGNLMTPDFETNAVALRKWQRDGSDAATARRR